MIDYGLYRVPERLRFQGNNCLNLLVGVRVFQYQIVETGRVD